MTQSPQWCGITTITIGTVYTTLAPTIFITLLSFNSLIHLISTIYHNNTGDKRARHDHLVAFLTTGLFATAVGLLTFVGNHLFALIGITGSTLGIGYTIVKGYQDYQAQKAKLVAHGSTISIIEQQKTNPIMMYHYSSR